MHDVCCSQVDVLVCTEWSLSVGDILRLEGRLNYPYCLCVLCFKANMRLVCSVLFVCDRLSLLALMLPAVISSCHLQNRLKWNMIKLI